MSLRWSFGTFSTVCQVIRTRFVKDEYSICRSWRIFLNSGQDEQGTHTQLLQNKQLLITQVMILKGSSDVTCTFTSCLKLKLHEIYVGSVCTQPLYNDKSPPMFFVFFNLVKSFPLSQIEPISDACLCDVT